MAGRFDPDFAETCVAKSDGGAVVHGPPVIPWLLVVAANLGLPVALGLLLTTGDGVVGMSLGVLAVTAVGCLACFKIGAAVRTVADGGWILAYFQILPIPQIMAGRAGVYGTSRLIDLGKSGEIETLAGGLVATLITAFLLILFAGFMGRGMNGMGWGPFFRKSDDAPRKPTA